MRGVRLHEERGKEIVVYATGVYGVPSETRERAFHDVSLEAGTCSCYAFRYSPSDPCKHVIAATIFEAKGAGSDRGREARKGSAAYRIGFEDGRGATDFGVDRYGEHEFLAGEYGRGVRDGIAKRRGTPFGSRGVA